MTVQMQTQNRVALVTLRRPDVRNAVDADTAQALYAAFPQATLRFSAGAGRHGEF